MDNPKFIVVCDSVGSLSAALKFLEQGFHVRIFSSNRIRRLESVKIKDGIEAQPEVVNLLARLGVPLDRTAEGKPDIRNGKLYAGADTGAQILFKLDDQLRKYETKKLLTRFEFWRFNGVVRDSSNKSLGITATNVKTLDIRPFSADAVILDEGYCDRFRETEGLFTIGSSLNMTSSLTGGFNVAEIVLEHVLNKTKLLDSSYNTFFEEEIKRLNSWMKSLVSQDGTENIYELKRELDSILKTRGLNESTDIKLQELEERFKNCATFDRSKWANQEIIEKMNFCDRLNFFRLKFRGNIGEMDSLKPVSVKGVGEWLS